MRTLRVSLGVMVQLMPFRQFSVSSSTAVVLSLRPLCECLRVYDGFPVVEEALSFLNYDGCFVVEEAVSLSQVLWISFF